MRRTMTAFMTVMALAVVAWIGASEGWERRTVDNWKQVAPGVFRSTGMPCAYLLVDGDKSVVIGAPRLASFGELDQLGVKGRPVVLLTHHHRDTSAQALQLLKEGFDVRAPKSSAPWLEPDGVRKYWETSLPVLVPGKVPGLRDRTFGVWDYLVHPVGGVPCVLDENEQLELPGWTLRVVPTPGHSRDHVSYAAYRKNPNSTAAAPIIFCGDALAGTGKLWAPYTTDWHHCYSDGLDAAAKSLRKLAELKPALLLPEHGEPISDDIVTVLKQTADAAEENSRLKSFEWYTKQRLGDAPQYSYLAKDQVATAGAKPWSQLSKHLFLTGNTYVIASQDGPILVIDPFGPTIVEQIRLLQKQFKLGPIETVVISHAHNDHYTGAFQLPDRNTWKLWTLDLIAKPIREPFFYRAPYLDARSVTVDRELKDGQTIQWREYELQVDHQPGQSFFSMGLRTTIDGHGCYLTADNFFHADQFTGTGGWSGRNRSWPDLYAQSAQKVLDASPDWVLAEHGGPFAFHAEDMHRRVRWGKAAARQADQLSPTGNHRQDWDPHRIHIEPFLLKATVGQIASAELVVTNHLDQPEMLTVEIDAHELVDNLKLTLTVPPNSTVRRAIKLRVRELPAGRQIVPLIVSHEDANGGIHEDGADVFFVLEAEAK